MCQSRGNTELPRSSLSVTAQASTSRKSPVAPSALDHSAASTLPRTTHHLATGSNGLVQRACS